MTQLQDLVEILLSTRDKDLLEDFLISLTTEKERTEILQRIEIIKLLLAGNSQHHIAAQLGVGVATVTRGSKELSSGRFKLIKQNLDSIGKQP